MNKQLQRTEALDMTLTKKGSAKWSARLANGPLPVAACCATNPSAASMASLPFLSSFSFNVLKSPLENPAGSKMPPGYPGVLPADNYRKRKRKKNRNLDFQKLAGEINRSSCRKKRWGATPPFNPRR